MDLAEFLFTQVDPDIPLPEQLLDTHVWVTADKSEVLLAGRLDDMVGSLPGVYQERGKSGGHARPDFQVLSCRSAPIPGTSAVPMPFRQFLNVATDHGFGIIMVYRRHGVDATIVLDPDRMNELACASFPAGYEGQRSIRVEELEIASFDARQRRRFREIIEKRALPITVGIVMQGEFDGVVSHVLYFDTAEPNFDLSDPRLRALAEGLLEIAPRFAVSREIGLKCDAHNLGFQYVDGAFHYNWPTQERGSAGLA